LFDVYSVAQLAEQLFPGRGQALSLLWRDKQIEYTRLVTTSRRYGQLGTPDISPPFYRPFGELTRGPHWSMPSKK
jgi:2-haloacid dehalogenase